MQEYRSLHPNHVHQLVASVSMHYYAGKDGLLKYQTKPFEISMAELADASRNHMVIFSLRDHHTGLFYAELGFGPDLPSLRDFLARAWGEKPLTPELHIQGLPKLMTIPKTLQAAFPDVIADIEALGIGLVDVTSGFQGGVRDLRTIEAGISHCVDKPVDEVLKWLPKLCAMYGKEKLRGTGRRKIDIWQEQVPVLRELPSDWLTG